MERLIMLPASPRPDGVPDVIRCALNPSDLELQRDAGLVDRPARVFAQSDVAGAGSGSTMPGAELGFGGSGRTTLTLRLLFETPASGNSLPPDVRTQTRPLYLLSAPVVGHAGRPCPVDLIWGKTWSFRGAVSRVAEKLERFTPEGIATRSWLQVEFEALPAAWVSSAATIRRPDRVTR